MFQVNPLPRQRIQIKNQALFSSKDKSKKLKCRLLQFLFGALRVKRCGLYQLSNLVTCVVNHEFLYLPCYNWPFCI